MNQTIAALQAQIPALEVEIATLQQSQETRNQERSAFRVAVDFAPSNSPQAVTELRRRSMTQGVKWLEELKELDRAIASLNTLIAQKQGQLSQKQALLDKLQAQQHQQELEQQVQTSGRRLQAQAQRINQLALRLEAEIRALKGLCDEVNPIYSEWLQQPINLVEFSVPGVPFVFVQETRLELGNKGIDWEASQQQQ